MFYKLCALISISALWGITNPLLKRNSKSIITIKSHSIIKQFLLELKYLATNIHYLIPMGLNQMGSILYFLTLQKVDLILTGPIVNSLTFIFTAISELYLDKKVPSKRVLIGSLLILIGTGFCCYNTR